MVGHCNKEPASTKDYDCSIKGVSTHNILIYNSDDDPMWDDEFDLHVVIACPIGAITKGHTSKNLTPAEDTFVGIVMARHQWCHVADST